MGLCVHIYYTNNIIEMLNRNLGTYNDLFRFIKAASPACTELETIVLDWLGSYILIYILRCPKNKKLKTLQCLIQFKLGT